MRIVVGLVLLLSVSAVFAEDKPQAKKKNGPSAGALIWARETVAERLKVGEKSPEFAAGRDWLNVSRPLTFAEDLRGKVVILDFWCYCCINCLHVLPDLEYLEKRYADKPFAVVGVHSAKFANEKDAAQIREAVLRYDIHHPVVNDADFAIWRSFGASSWPTFAVVAPDGTLIGVLSGEGHRDELDAIVQALLEHFEQMAPKTLNAKPLPMRLEKTTKPPGQLAYPGKVLADEASGRLYVADSGHNRIVELGLDGTFKRAFGTGERGFVDGGADEARFYRPQGMALREGVLWVCDTENHAIRTIDLATGSVATAAGTGAKGKHWPLVHPRNAKPAHGPWPGKTTALNSPWDIVFLDGVGHIAMAGSHSMWTIDPKTSAVRHFAGDLSERRADHKDPYQAAFAQPSGLTTDGTYLYIADSESSAILRMSKAGEVITLAGAKPSAPTNLFHFGDEDGAGPGKRFQHPLGVQFYKGHIWVADSYNHKIKRLDPKTGRVRTYAGTGTAGHSLLGAPVNFAEPSGLSVAGEVIYVADTNNHVIRTIRTSPETQRGVVETLVLKGVPIPRAHSRGGMSDVWPVMSGTVDGGTVKATVSLDDAVSVELALGLPPGWKLTEGAPSVVRAEYLSGQDLRWSHVDAKITGTTTTLSVPVARGGSSNATVVLRAIYYICQDGGQCRVRSVDFKLELTSSGKPGPAKPIRVADLFLADGK